MKKLNIAVVIVSDTRTDDTDKSGKKLKSLIETDGHSLVSKIIIKDNIYQIRKFCLNILDNTVDAVIISGGKVLQVLMEQKIPLLDKIIDGFGNIQAEVKNKNLVTQSRAVAISQ